MEYVIRDRNEERPIYSCIAESWREVVESAIKNGVSLIGAHLASLDLRGADLRGADLYDVLLSGADLRGANLYDTDLAGADLRGALGVEDAQVEYRDDIWAILDQAPTEVAGLVALMHAGKIDGNVYRGDCACLVGSIANLRGCEYDAMDIQPDGGRPAERWFGCIRPGNTPANHAPSAIALEWIQEWQAKRAAAVSP